MRALVGLAAIDAKAKSIDLRTAAYAHALHRLGPALESTGTSRNYAKE